MIPSISTCDAYTRNLAIGSILGTEVLDIASRGGLVSKNKVIATRKAAQKTTKMMTPRSVLQVILSGGGKR